MRNNYFFWCNKLVGLTIFTQVGKAGAYLRVEQLKCCSVGYVPGLPYKHWTKLERPAMDKHYSLLQKFVIGPRVKARGTRYVPALEGYIVVYQRIIPETKVVGWYLPKP